MKLNIFLLLVIAYSISVYSQEKDSITYVFPDNVEMKLYERIKEIPSFDSYNFEFYLQSIEKDTFRLSFTYYSGLIDNFWAKNTNRFILINDKKYPLILDYDSMFSTKNSKEVGEFGKRDDGFVLRSLFIYKGYNIKFTKTGRYISENWGLYRRIEEAE